MSTDVDGSCDVYVMLCDHTDFCTSHAAKFGPTEFYQSLFGHPSMAPPAASLTRVVSQSGGVADSGSLLSITTSTTGWNASGGNGSTPSST